MKCWCTKNKGIQWNKNIRSYSSVSSIVNAWSGLGKGFGHWQNFYVSKYLINMSKSVRNDRAVIWELFRSKPLPFHRWSYHNFLILHDNLWQLFFDHVEFKMNVLTVSYSWVAPFLDEVVGFLSNFLDWYGNTIIDF